MKEIVKYIKDVKKGLYKEKIFVADLFIFSILKKYNIRLEYLLYSSTFNYSDEAIKILNEIKKYADNILDVNIKIIENLKDKKNQIEFVGVINYKKSDFDNLNSDVVLVLDGIEIPGNLGTIFRTCDATNISDVILVNSVTHIENPLVLQSSRGMLLKNKIVESNFDNTIKFLKENNYNIYLGEPINGLEYNKYDYNGKVAIVMGSERFGIDKRWYEYEHYDCFIPMKGEIESLNVAIATSIMLYEISFKKNIN